MSNSYHHEMIRTYQPDEDRQAKALAWLLSRAAYKGRKLQQRERANRLIARSRGRYRRARRKAS